MSPFFQNSYLTSKNDNYETETISVRTCKQYKSNSTTESEDRRARRLMYFLLACTCSTGTSCLSNDHPGESSLEKNCHQEQSFWRLLSPR